MGYIKIVCIALVYLRCSFTLDYWCKDDLNVCYYTNGTDMIFKFADAENECRKNGSILMEIYDETYQNASIEAYSKLNKIYGYTAWLNMKRINGQMKWISSGENVVYKNWLRDEPGWQTCYIFGSDYRWDALACSSPAIFICMKIIDTTATTQTLASDTTSAPLVTMTYGRTSSTLESQKLSTEPLGNPTPQDTAVTSYLLSTNGAGAQTYAGVETSSKLLTTMTFGKTSQKSESLNLSTAPLGNPTPQDSAVTSYLLSTNSAGAQTYAGVETSSKLLTTMTFGKISLKSESVNLSTAPLGNPTPQDSAVTSYLLSTNGTGAQTYAGVETFSKLLTTMTYGKTSVRSESDKFSSSSVKVSSVTPQSQSSYQLTIDPSGSINSTPSDFTIAVALSLLALLMTN